MAEPLDPLFLQHGMIIPFAQLSMLSVLSMAQNPVNASKVSFCRVYYVCLVCAITMTCQYASLSSTYPSRLLGPPIPSGHSPIERHTGRPTHYWQVGRGVPVVHFSSIPLPENGK